VTAQLERLRSVGATDFIAIPTGDAEDRRRTLDHLATLRGSTPMLASVSIRGG